MQTPGGSCSLKYDWHAVYISSEGFKFSFLPCAHMSMRNWELKGKKKKKFRKLWAKKLSLRTRSFGSLFFFLCNGICPCVSKKKKSRTVRCMIRLFGTADRKTLDQWIPVDRSIISAKYQPTRDHGSFKMKLLNANRFSSKFQIWSIVNLKHKVCSGELQIRSSVTVEHSKWLRLFKFDQMLCCCCSIDTQIKWVCCRSYLFISMITTPLSFDLSLKVVVSGPQVADL